MIKTNYHTHCEFCDGKNTAQEMIESAVEKNFDILGFSSHSMYPYSSDWHVASREHLKYVQEIKWLAQENADRIKVYAGFEADYISGFCCPSFSNYDEFKPDYLIGSVHFVYGNRGFFEADGNPKTTRENIDAYFGGDVRRAVCEYFCLEREMLEKGNFTFLGHPDLVRKQNIHSVLFDESESWYRDELVLLAKAAARSGVCAEINTGGTIRYGMKEPYPSLQLLELFRENNVPVTINSDAHSCDGLDAWFDRALEYVKKAGYTELMYYEDGRLKLQKI